MVAAMVIMGTTLALTGRPAQIPAEFWGAILLSSLTGLGLGDFLLFATMRRLGPRRTNIQLATNAPIAAFFGWLLLDEVIGFETLLSILFGFFGVVLATIGYVLSNLMAQHLIEVSRRSVL